MKRIAQFCVRHGILLDQEWFRRWIDSSLFKPIHPRDRGTVAGVFDLGANTSPKSVKRFERWWKP